MKTQTMKTLTSLLLAASTLTLAACDEPVDLDAPEQLQLTPAQLDELEVALDVHEAELVEDAEIPAPLLDIDMSEAEPSNEYACTDLMAEYCMTLSSELYSGQCLGHNVLVPGFCLLVGSQFGPCEYQAAACSQI